MRRLTVAAQLKHRTVRRRKTGLMCLTLTIRAPVAARPQLEEAARSLPASALHLDVEHARRWAWAKPNDIRATISESGGCACSLLADDADWEAPFWSMRPEVLAPLARTLEVVAASDLGEFSIEALWTGEEAEDEQQLCVPELLAHIHAGQLGTKTRYRVRAHAV